MKQMPNSVTNAELTTSAPTCPNTMLAAGKLGEKRVVLLYDLNKRNEFDKLQADLFNKLLFLKRHKSDNSEKLKEYIDSHCSIEILCDLASKIAGAQKKSIVGSISLTLE